MLLEDSKGVRAIGVWPQWGWRVTEDQLGEGPSFQAETRAGEKVGEGTGLRVETQEFTDLDLQSIQSSESLEQHLAVGGEGKGPLPSALCPWPKSTRFILTQVRVLLRYG